MNENGTKKGFFTFLATVVIAASIYFSAYFAVNTLNSKALDKQEVKGSETTKVGEANANAEKPSLFANLVDDQKDSKPNTLAMSKPKPKVLGASDVTETTSGAVPNTGSGSIAGVVIIGSSLMLIGTHLGKRKAREIAIKAFENGIFKKF